jgi:hypothetical protein
MRNINIYKHAALQHNPDARNYSDSEVSQHGKRNDLQISVQHKTYMYFEHYKIMFQNNVNKNKTCLLCSIYSNRNRDPTPTSEIAVKHVHIDTNITLNVEPFPLCLIVVLSCRCHFSDLVWFDVSKPLFCFTSLHKVHAPNLAWLESTCCKLPTTDQLEPTLALLVSLSCPFLNHNPKNTTFTVCQGWRYCPFHYLKLNMILYSKGTVFFIALSSLED